MNPNLHEELQSYSNELRNSLSGQSELIKSTLISFEKKCHSYAGDDSDLFVTCMLDAQKVISKEENRLELRTAFFQAKFSECLLNSDTNSEKLRKCKDNAIFNIKDAFSTFITNLNNAK